MLQYLVFVGAAVQLFGITFYIKETIRGKTKPNRVSWLLWSIAPFIAVAAAISDGVGWSILPVFMAGFNPSLVFIASFINPKAYWKLTRFDYLCGFFSILALVLWGVTREPIVAVAFAIVSDAFASVPTIAKMWKYPKTETVTPFFASLFSAGTSFLAIQTWNFTAYAFPVYLDIVSNVIIFAFYRRRLWAHERKSVL